MSEKPKMLTSTKIMLIVLITVTVTCVAAIVLSATNGSSDTSSRNNDYNSPTQDSMF